MSIPFSQLDTNTSHGNGLPTAVALRYVSYLVKNNNLEEAFHVARHVMTDVNRAPAKITPVFIANCGSPKGVHTYFDAHHLLVKHHKNRYPEDGNDLLEAFTRMSFSAKRENDLIMRALYNASPEQMVSYPIGDYPVDNFLDIPDTFPVEELVASYIECIKTHNAEAIRLVALMLFLATRPGIATKELQCLKFKEGRSKPETLKYRANMTSRVEFRVQGVLEHNVRNFLQQAKRAEEDKHARFLWKLETPESAVLAAEYLCLPPDSIAPMPSPPVPELQRRPMCTAEGEFLCTLPELPREANEPGMENYFEFYRWYFKKYAPKMAVTPELMRKLTKNMNRTNETDPESAVFSFTSLMFRIFPLRASPLSMTVRPSMIVRRIEKREGAHSPPVFDHFSDEFTNQLHSKDAVLYQSPIYFRQSPPLLQADVYMNYVYRGPYVSYPGYIMARQKVFDLLGVSHLIVPSVIMRDTRKKFWVRSENLITDPDAEFRLSGPSRGSKNRQFVYARDLPLEYFLAKTKEEALGVLSQDVITYMLALYVMNAGLLNVTCNLVKVDGKIIFTKYHQPPQKRYAGSGPALLMKVFKENDYTGPMNALYYAIAFRPEVVARVRHALNLFREKMPQIVRFFEEYDLTEHIELVNYRLEEIQRNLQ